MLEENEILAVLEKHGIPVTGSLVRDVSSTNRLYVFVSVHRNKKNHQVPSNAVLSKAKVLFESQHIDIDFILTDGLKRDEEAGLRATMLHSFGNYLRNVYFSTEGNKADIWLDQKRQIEPEILEAIKEKAVLFLAQVGLELRSISNQADENLPSKTVCLQYLRRFSPVSQDDLSEKIRRGKFVVPSDDWMARRLDSLRKAGLVTRLESGEYSLTLSALRALGTAKNASSPDVTRLLAIASGRH